MQWPCLYCIVRPQKLRSRHESRAGGLVPGGAAPSVVRNCGRKGVFFPVLYRSVLSKAGEDEDASTFASLHAAVHAVTGGTRVFRNSCATRNPRLYCSVKSGPLYAGS